MTGSHASFTVGGKRLTGGSWSMTPVTPVLSDGDALLRAIITHPDEDTPRLVYADWLQEVGEESRAEFIRVQCRLVGLVPSAMESKPISAARAELVALSVRADKLLHENRDWLPFAYMWIDGGSPFDSIHCGQGGGAGLRQTEMHVRRGFISDLTCSAADWLAHGDAIRERHPVTVVRLTSWVPMDERFSPDGFAEYRIKDRTHWIGVDEIAHGGEVALYLLAREWPGVTFELPPAPRWTDDNAVAAAIQPGNPAGPTGG